MKSDFESMKKLPRKSSKDYLELMHLALEMNDKEWFEELAKERERIEKIEEKIKLELGWKEDE
ncbi:hypothetical protein [Niallia sp. MER 6]|uniref:hypothetical protein n=1 Tax=Niallia sp. MER 6 TaxID=2939567 RepID=UPI0020401F19|nr:hypothetical protein [Niallia sp. MER 6]MCM3034094.1 hypothetical protein [Niallia sp. MER 6]